MNTEILECIAKTCIFSHYVTAKLPIDYWPKKLDSHRAIGDILNFMLSPLNTTQIQHSMLKETYRTKIANRADLIDLSSYTNMI